MNDLFNFLTLGVFDRSVKTGQVWRHKKTLTEVQITDCGFSTVNIRTAQSGSITRTIAKKKLKQSYEFVRFVRNGGKNENS